LAYLCFLLDVENIDLLYFPFLSTLLGSRKKTFKLGVADQTKEEYFLVGPEGSLNI